MLKPKPFQVNPDHLLPTIQDVPVSYPVRLHEWQVLLRESWIDINVPLQLVPASNSYD